MSLSTVAGILLIGLIGGFVSGSLGVGGGIIIIPALAYFFGMSQHEAQGTSLGLLLLPVVALGTYNYYKEGYINYKFVLIMAVTFVIGGYLGSKMSVYLPDKVLKKMFGGLLILAGLKMILSK